MSKRVKMSVAAPKTREEMENLVGEIAELKIEERQIKAEMDRELKLVKDTYTAQLAQVSDQLVMRMPKALAWAEAHPEDFGKSRSVEMLHGTVGWRITPPALKTLAGWTWDRVLEKIHAMGFGLSYVRTKEEVNKQAILADRETCAETLRTLGVRVVQEDEFFVEPKLTESEAREKVQS